MKTSFSIYAAPRDPRGRYRFSDDKPMYRRKFPSLAEMQEFWAAAVVPQSESRAGALYELSMVVHSDGKWSFHGEPRYSDEPVLGEAYLA